MQNLWKFSTFLSAVLGACLLVVAGCSAQTMTEEENALTQQPVINGSDPIGKPYEQLFAKVNGCSGTLIGGPTTAKWVLSASHCFGNTNGSQLPPPSTTYTVTRGTDSRQTIAGRVFFAPPAPDGNWVDAALLEMETTMTVPGSVYFTNSDATQLIGTPVRCYGYGRNGIGKTGLLWGDFTIKENSGSTVYYQLAVPNGAGQSLAPGDSGASCFHSAAQATADITLTGVHKSGSTSAPYNFNRQTGAKWMSAWIRTFVPRPNCSTGPC